MSYEKHRIKYIRGSILDFVAHQSQPDTVLLLALEDMNLAIPHDQMSGIISWLQQAGLVIARKQDGFSIISITQSGFDIVKARTRHPEIIMSGDIV